MEDDRCRMQLTSSQYPSAQLQIPFTYADSQQETLRGTNLTILHWLLNQFSAVEAHSLHQHIQEAEAATSTCKIHDILEDESSTMLTLFCQKYQTEATLLPSYMGLLIAIFNLTFLDLNVKPKLKDSSYHDHLFFIISIRKFLHIY